MEIFKKIIGYILMVLAIMLAIALLSTLPNSILKSLDQIQENKIDGIAYFIGTMIANVIFTLIIIFMVRKGLKLIQNKKIESNNTSNKLKL
jgi:flagellar biosynthesis protein FliQ